MGTLRILNTILTPKPPTSFFSILVLFVLVFYSKEPVVTLSKRTLSFRESRSLESYYRLGFPYLVHTSDPSPPLVPPSNARITTTSRCPSLHTPSLSRLSQIVSNTIDVNRLKPTSKLRILFINRRCTEFYR